MSKFAHLLVMTTALGALAACSSNSTPPVAVAPAPAPAPVTPVVVVTPPPTSATLAATAAGTALPLTARAGLEAFVFTNGSAAASQSEVPAGSIQSNPTAAYVTTANGFTFTLPDGKTATFVTTAGSSQTTTGPQTYPIGSGENQTPQRFQTNVNGGTNQVSVSLSNATNSNLEYSTYGTWVQSASINNPIAAGTFATGVVSTQAQMPTTGTATYNGSLTGFGNSPTAAFTITDGAVALNANFATNTMTGTITNISTQSGGATPANSMMNNITLTGGRISGTSFSGIAAASAVAGPTNVTGATGAFGGKFYGTAASEAAGSLTMTGAGSTVVGVFGAKK